MRKIYSVFIILFLVGLVQGAEVTIGDNHEFLVNGTPLFPIFNWLQPSENIAHQKTLGFNTFFGEVGYSAVYLSGCETRDVWGIVSHDATASMSKNMSSLLGWRFEDEPDLNGFPIPPDTIQSEYNAIKADDPDHPTMLTLTGQFYDNYDARYYDYCAATDVVGFDRYPIYGYCRKDKIFWAADVQDTLRYRFARNQKPVYQWIECCQCVGKWCYYSERSGQGPFPNEIRAQVWLAIIHGAKGIGYFTHSWRPDNCSTKGDEYYSQYHVTAAQETELARSNSAITTLAPVICSAESDINVTADIISGTGRVDITVREYDGQLYIIAANVLHFNQQSSNTQTVEITVPDLSSYASEVTVFEESRTITPSGNTFTDVFTEAEPVHIYVLGAGTGELANYIMPLPSTTSLKDKPAARKTSVSFLHLENGSQAPGRKEFNFYCPTGTRAQVNITNAAGRTVKKLLNGETQSFLTRLYWNETDLAGRRTAPGVYYCVATTTDQQQITAVLVVE